MEEKYIVALETGSSKIRGAIGSVDSSGTLTVRAVEEEKLTDCVRYGWVRNVADVSAAVANILARLEAREPGRKITGVYAALGGKSTMLSTCRVERRLPAETEITDDHVRRMAQEAGSQALSERDVVAVNPRKFTVDKTVTRNPVGTFGSSIDAVYNLVSCRNQIKRNLNHVLNRCSVAVNGMVVRQLAIADLVLTSEERRLGSMLVDFGAETVTVSIYKDGVLCYLATLPMGSRNITIDITSLHHLEENAERLKRTVGNADPRPSDGIDAADYTEINNIVSARAAEIIANINEQIKYAGLTPADLPAGIVIVGGGAKLRGFNSRLEQTTHLKVRIGMPASSIRMADSRIQPADAIDVIAILAHVAQKARPCMTDPAPAEPVVEKQQPVKPDDPRPRKPLEYKPEPEDDPLEGIEDQQPKGPSRLTILANKFKDRLARMAQNHEYEEEDDNFGEID